MVRLPRLFAEAADETEERASAPSSPSVAGSTVGAAPAAPLNSSQLQDLRNAMELIYGEVKEFNERESAQEKVFNSLYKELNDYKNDFLYEHMKPVVRPLLFLYDSLEEFDDEIASFQWPTTDERRNAMPPHLVRQNVSYFKEQLVEALRICEVTLMEKPEGEFDPKLHKAVEVMAVEPEQDRKIQRVIRNGWYLNNQLLRPAEIVLGRAK